MSQPTVTVLIPTYNARQFFPLLLASLKSQTYKNWRAVVYDSYSTDGTRELVNSMGDSRFTLRSGPREGIYAAWNAMRREVETEFCCITPADDTVDPSFLEIGVEMLTQHPEGAAFACPVRFIDERSESLGFQMEKHPASCFLPLGVSAPQKRDGTTDALLHLALDMMYVSMTGLLFRTGEFLAAGAFRTDLGSTADREWTLRFLVNRTIIYSGVARATWRIRKGQASGQIRIDDENERRWGYEKEFLQRCLSMNVCSPGIFAFWRRTRPLREFLLRVEYRRRGRIDRASIDMLRLARRDPWLTLLAVTHLHGPGAYCHSRRVNLARAILRLQQDRTDKGP